MRYYEFDGRIVAPRWQWNKTIEGTTMLELPGGPAINKLFSFAAAATTVAKIR